MPCKEGFVSFGRYRTWFQVIGPSVVTDKRPVLCLHGGPGLPHDYLQPLDRLATAGWQVIFYDQLGCGNSDAHTDPSLCTIETFVQELEAVRTQLDLQEVHLFGHSWGGLLAQEYVLTRPRGVISLIAASTLASMPLLIAEIRRLRLALPPEYRDRVEAATVLAFTRAHGCRLNEWPDCLIRSFNKYLQNDFVSRTMLGPSVLQIEGRLRNRDISDRLKEIDLPVLVSCGRYDYTTPVVARQIAGGIRNSELRIFENSSHTSHLEEPDAYLEAVEAFLVRGEGGG